eukprot:gene12743-12872_t
MASAWSLPQTDREVTVERIANNIISIAFFKGLTISDGEAKAAAAAAEKKAYMAAQVAARTTTGNRPAAETTSAYARKLGELVLAAVVDLHGSRDFLDAESARQALAPLLVAGAKIRQVRFSTKSFGVEAATEDEALEALRILSAALSTAKLRHLNLSDNALGEKGVRAAAAALQHQGLHLFNNMSGDEGAAHIGRLLSRCPGMTDFKMASSRVGPEGGISIAKALSAGHNLVRLDLSDNPLTEEVAPALAALVAAQPNIKSLNLNDTSLTDEGITAVCKALAGGAPQLEVLELALNEVTPAGAHALAVAVANKQHLARLNLRENELEDAGAVVLAKVLPSLPALQVLDLCSNQLMRLGVLAVAKALAARQKSNPVGFDLLALDENAISEEGIEQLGEVLKGAFGNDSMLGPLDDNDPDMAGDDDGDEDEAALQGSVGDELTEALAKVNL